MIAKEFARCRARLQRYLTALPDPLGRRDRRDWGTFYVRGLLLSGERKSIVLLAHRVPEGNVQALQQFAGQSSWDVTPVRAHLAWWMVHELSPGTAWVVDEVGFSKQGKHAVGVARQSCGSSGRPGSCRVALWLNYTTDDAASP